MKPLTQKQKNEAFAVFLEGESEEKPLDVKEELNKIFAAAAGAWDSGGKQWKKKESKKT